MFEHMVHVCNPPCRHTQNSPEISVLEINIDMGLLVDTGDDFDAINLSVRCCRICILSNLAFS